MGVMHTTDVLVGMHGAGLANALFLSANSGVLEITHNQWSARHYQLQCLNAGVLHMFSKMHLPTEACMVGPEAGGADPRCWSMEPCVVPRCPLECAHFLRLCDVRVNIRAFTKDLVHLLGRVAKAKYSRD